MTLKQFYRRNKDELMFGGTLVVMVVAGSLMSDMLTRAITDSPLKITIWRLVSPLGLDAAAPGVVLFGSYVTALTLLTIDQTKRPQSMFLILVTGIGLVMLALSGQFFPYLGIGDVALFLLGVALALLYVGPTNLREMSKSRTDPLEFRSAEQLLYGLLGLIVVVAFFEAHTRYPPLVEPSLLPNFDAVTSVQLTDIDGGKLALDAGVTGVFLIMLFFFLGYDAERTYFIVGPKRSGKTHAAIALHEEAEEYGYNPRNEAKDLIELETRLVEQNEWVEATTRTTQNLSFSFTSRGIFKKNIQLEAIDYPGELVRAILPAVRYHTEPKESLIEEYPNVETREEWLQVKIRESKEKDVEVDPDPTVMDGGVKDETPRTTPTDETSQPESATDEAFAPADDDALGDVFTDDGDDSGNEDDPGAPIRTESEPDAFPEIDLVKNEIYPAFERADTLLLVVDLEKYLAGEPVGADVLYRIFDQSGKDAIVLATKADLLADEFTETHGWKSAWTNEAYDEFRTYVENELATHNVLLKILNDVERPYPVGYQTTKPDVDTGGDDLQRKLAQGGGLATKRVQVHGYEYVLERLN